VLNKPKAQSRNKAAQISKTPHLGKIMEAVLHHTANRIAFQETE
jgi:hypothetical protein